METAKQAGKRERVLAAIAEFLRTHEQVEITNWKTGLTELEWFPISSRNKTKGKAGSGKA